MCTYKNRYTEKEIAYRNDPFNFFPHPIHFIKSLFREPVLVEGLDIPPFFPNPIHWFWVLCGRPKPVDKSGICGSCGEKVQNLGGHIDFCIDGKIW